MDMSPLVVRQHRPVRARLIAALLIVVTVIGGWLLFEYGRYRAGYDRMAVAVEKSSLMAKINDLTLGLDGMREKSAILERSSQIDRQANTVVKGSVLELQDEILELKQELAFYRSIVAPNENKVGVRIQSLKLFGSREQRLFRYNLMLTQVLKSNILARGKVKLVIDGLENGAPRRLTFGDVTAGKKDDPKFRFKYFQNLEGEFRLPESYVPQSVTVDVVPSGKRLPRVRKSFDWVAEG